MTRRSEQSPDPEVRSYRPPRRYSAEYKQRILDEYEQLDRAGKGALLRREGLVRREALDVEGGGRPLRWAVVAARLKLSAA